LKRGESIYFPEKSKLRREIEGRDVAYQVGEVEEPTIYLIEDGWADSKRESDAVQG